jgi:predicted nuclease with TOPRIM domain
MSFNNLCVRHICYRGPEKEPAEVRFKKGLNVVCGASNTGKSFLVSSIDFMLGASPPLTDIPERDGYERILMGLEASDSSTYTLERSVEGGGFRCFKYLLTDTPEDSSYTQLAPKHSISNEDNVSSFILRLIGLGNKYVRRNQAGETNSLSFRNLVSFSIINEQDIIKKLSPIHGGQYIERTLEYSIFKLLLTGMDDGSLVSQKIQEQEKARMDSELDTIEHILSDYEKELSEITKHPTELEEQLEKLEASIKSKNELLREMQQNLQHISLERQELWNKRQPLISRIEEINELLVRFELLEKHYASDIDRLEAIKESGTLFIPLEAITCPLCGALPEDQRHDKCEGNIEAIVEAAIAEMNKIQVLNKELKDTVSTLIKERNSLNEEVMEYDKELAIVQEQISSTISPNLSDMQTSYATLLEKRSEIVRAIQLIGRMRDYEQRRTALVRSAESFEPQETFTELSTNILSSFARTVEDILQAWRFPGAERIYFDEAHLDLIISGKLRSSYGKGLRAITHAAFTIALMEYCRRNNRPHPGFVVLDSPLLAYKEPEGEEDDLRGTDLKDRFYEHISSLSDSMQIIVFENEHPSEKVKEQIEFIDFTGNPHRGRSGFFPT